MKRKTIEGIYKIVIKFGSPEFVINHISIVHQAYFRALQLKQKI